MSAGSVGGGGGGGNNSAAMTLANAVVAVQADTRALHQQLNAVQKHLNGLQSSAASVSVKSDAEEEVDSIGSALSTMIQEVLSALGDGAASIVDVIAGGTLAASVAYITHSFVQMAAETETAATSFEVLVGSAEKARALVEEINTLAAETPFQTPELHRAVQASLQYGYTVREAIDQVKMLGDISAISQAPIDELTRMYARMKSAGQYATVGSDFLGMMESRGILSRKTIAEKLGIGETALQERISKGMLKWKQIEPIFKSLTSEGGDFFQGMIKQSKTYQGLASTLADSINLVGEAFGRIFLESAKRTIESLVLALNTTRKWVSAIAEFNTTSGGMVSRLATALAVSTALVAVVPRLITGIRLLTSAMNISLASTGWGALIVALGGVIYLVLSVGAAMRKASGENGTLVKIGESFVNLWDKAKVAFAKFGDAFMRAVEPMMLAFEDGISRVVRFLDDNMETVVQIVEYAATMMQVVIESTATGWIAQFQTIVLAAFAVGDALAGIFNSDIGSMLSFQLKANLWLMEDLAATAVWVSNVFVQYIETASYLAVGYVDAIVRVAKTLYHAFDGAIGVLSVLTSAIGGVVGTIYGKLSGAFESIFAGVTEFFGGLAGLIKSALTLDFKGILSSFKKMFSGVSQMANGMASAIKNAMRSAFSFNAGSFLKGVVGDIQKQLSGTASKMYDSATQESDSLKMARKKAFRDDRDTRTKKEIKADMRAERKWGDTWGAGARAIAEAVSNSGKKDDKGDPGSGGGMLMRAGFVGLDQAATDMQQILLDEMKGDQQLGVLQDIRDVQKETLELQKKGLAMGEGESKAPVLAP